MKATVFEEYKFLIGGWVIESLSRTGRPPVQSGIFLVVYLKVVALNILAFQPKILPITKSVLNIFDQVK